MKLLTNTLCAQSHLVPNDQVMFSIHTCLVISIVCINLKILVLT